MNGGCPEPRVTPSSGESETVLLPENRAEQKPQQNNAEPSTQFSEKLHVSLALV